MMSRAYTYDRAHNRLFTNVRLPNGKNYRIEAPHLGGIKARLAALLRVGARLA